ncbi:formate dehydrogenase subunit delta [Porticoccaceae bacterium]|jgi:hypothetical protein|nr:formate dehydrogenase subunit delta [Porticoccaceae bacterium]MDB2669710.1 formate dehydrogenase subunit delta [Porticoccaceae bacterium]MDC0524152.1 formate dehydrogenase subunit delta [Porticoccaceae bacterium]
MSTSKIDRLVKMINQISLNMSSNGSEEQVSVEVSEHLTKFWSPPMKSLISDYADDENIGLTPISRKAVIHLDTLQSLK